MPKVTTPIFSENLCYNGINLTIYANDSSVIEIKFSLAAQNNINQITSLARQQIIEYLQGLRQKFSIPIQLDTKSPTTKAVWSSLQNVVYGTTISYSALAEKSGLTKNHARAVARACATNPIPIIVPCHRVIASNGKISGYAGGVHLKERLLKLEA